LERAADALRSAEALLICTGAGMGVDSGFGTYRGRNAGIWAPLKALHMDLQDMSAPQHFETDPRLAWAFFCFRYRAYTSVMPHEGYDILSQWGARLKHGLFSVTSNVDGHWARTKGVGEERTYEVHGSLSHIQPLVGQRWNEALECYIGDGNVWPVDIKDIAALELPTWDLAPGEKVEVLLRPDAEEWMPAIVAKDGCAVELPDGSPLTAHAVRRPGQHDLCRVSESSVLPRCPTTGELARPNVIMFGDLKWCPTRINEQEAAFRKWQESLPKETRLVIVEVGAGKAIPTIRYAAEAATRDFPQATLIRINLDDSDVPDDLNAVSIGGMGAREALSKLDAMLGGSCGDCSPGARRDAGARASAVERNRSSLRESKNVRLPALQAPRSTAGRNRSVGRR